MTLFVKNVDILTNARRSIIICQRGNGDLKNSLLARSIYNILKSTVYVIIIMGSFKTNEIYLYDVEYYYI